MRSFSLPKKVYFCCLVMAVMVISVSASASSLVGNQIEIAVNPEYEVNPRIAFNSIRNEYLVVWWNDRVGCDDIRAQRLSGSGALLGPPFYIAAVCPHERRYPDVAYNRQHDEYLVVWEHNDNSIHGRRVSAEGQLLGTGEIEIATQSSEMPNSRKPRVEYAYTSDTYLVVWEVTLGTDPVEYAIYGQLLDHDGTLDDGIVSISRGTNERQAPDLAYNRHANRFLVVWQQKYGEINWDVYGQQVRGTGEIHGDELVLAYYTAPTTAPAAAAIPVTPGEEKFLVVWQLHYGESDHDIYARVVTEEGILQEAFILTDSYDYENTPAIAGSESSLKYLVTWGNGNHPGVWGRFVSYDGSQLEPIFDLSTSGMAPGNGDIAAGLTGDFLAVWHDDTEAESINDILGRLVGNRIYLPVILR